MNIEKNGICVSVIIPVFNEEKHIEECMKSLISQTFPIEKTEWIIVDGNSSDRTREILSRYTDRYPLIILTNEKKVTPVSLNIGITASHGRYIIRFDAHSVFPPDYIEKCVNCLKTTDADNVGGFVETRAEGQIGEAIVKLLSSPFGVGGSAFRLGAKEGYVDTVPYGAFRRDVFDRVGLFNEELLRSEDNDINARIIASGGKVYLSKDICSVYYCRDSVSGLLRQALQNGNALFRTIRQNPKAMSLRHFVPFMFLTSVVLLLILGFFSLVARYLLLTELACYLLLDIYFSFFYRSSKKGLMTLWLYPLYHLTYGAGSALGLLGAKLY